MRYNKFGLAALKAVEHLNKYKSSSPSESWDKATIQVFGRDNSSHKKGCPKSTFLAICETGRVKGVKPGVYTKADENKRYALKTLRLLEHNSESFSDAKDLWNALPESSETSYQQQMDVVLALWDSDFLLK